MTAIPAADDLVSTLDDLSDAVKEALKKIPYIENQVGAIFFSDNSVAGVDVYDIPLSWDAVKKEMIEKEGASFLKEDSANIFEFRPEKAKELVKEKIADSFEEKVIYDKEYKVVEIRGNNLIGEATVFNGDVIHVTLWKSQTN